MSKNKNPEWIAPLCCGGEMRHVGGGLFKCPICSDKDYGEPVNEPNRTSQFPSAQKPDA